MNLLYPLLILARDDRSIQKITAQSELDYFEQIDIEADEYSGWDMQAYPISLSWEPRVGPKAEIADSVPQPHKLREAVMNYAKMYSEVPFDCGESVSDIVELFDAVERHIEETKPPSLTKRFKRLFGR